MDETMIYQGSERTVRANQSPLQLFKGQESIIKQQAIQDGALYFATDSKKIYLDCDFTDSQGKVLNERLPFGGSSGIFFSKKEFSDMITDFTFTFSEIEGVLDAITGEKINIPKIDDIILDEANGTFYRVNEVNERSSFVRTTKLVVAGGGGGGGSGGGGGGSYQPFDCWLGTRSMAFSNTADEMLIQYVAYAPTGITGFTKQVDIEVYDRRSGNVLFTIDNITQSSASDEAMSFDIKRYIQTQIDNGTLAVNTDYTYLGFMFTDGTNRSTIQPVEHFAIVTLYLTPETANLPDYSADAIYGITPHFDSSLVRNAKITYEVIDQSYTLSYQTGTIENITNNTPSQANITYQQGRPVTIKSQLIGMVNGIQIVSAVLTQSLMFIDPSNPIPRIVILNWPSTENEAYTRTAIVNYRVTYGSAQVTSLSGHLQMFKKNSTNGYDLYSDTAIDFALSTNLQWTVPFEEEGEYRLKIIVGSGASQQVAEQMVNNAPVVYKVSGSSSTVPVVASGAQFDFTPDRDETSTVKDNWTTTWYNPDGRYNGSVTTVVGNETVAATFENFNWITNGWFKIPNSNKNKLVLNNGAKLTIPIAPFYGDFNPNSGSFNGAIATGKTIEFDVKISNIRDRKKRIIDCSCYEITSGDWQNDEPSVGIVATGDYFVLTSSQLNILDGMQTNGIVNDTVNGLVAHYSADERVHICYVIARQDADIDARYPKNYIYTYVNGVLSGVVARNDNDNFRQTPTDSFDIKTVFSSEYADIELYNFRFYGKALSAEAVLDNYLAGSTNIDDAIKRKASNNITEYYNDPSGVTTRNYSYIDLGKTIRSASIPYLVLRGGYRCDKKGKTMSQEIANAEVSLPYFDKKDYRYMEAYFVDPDNFDRCFGIKDPIYDDNNKIIGFTSTSADRWKVTIYPQGTSSLEYPVKNLRMKTINDKNVNQQKRYQLFPNTPLCALFTFKADFMDSSMSHNTGTANQLNDLYQSADITFDPVAALRGTDNEYADYNLLTAIQGRPCVIFYRHVGIQPGTEFTGTDLYSDYDFVGRYNFNFDKGEPELFGFFSDEHNKYGIVLNNNEPVPGFEALIDGDESEVYDENLAYYTAPILDQETGLPDETKRWYPDASAEDKDEALSDYLANYPLYVYKNVRNSIQCWEMKNNNNNLTSFRTPWDDAYDREPHPRYNQNNELISEGKPYETWIAAYESRYPEYIEQGAADKRAFSAFLNWLASTNLMTATNEELVTPVTYSGVNYTTDSQAYRLAKFKNEFNSHMKLNFTTFYYIMTELEILMDSRAKNMMMVSYDADNETGTGHWYPIFYDMDTAMGVNNTGKLVYRYDVQDTTFGIFNTTADYPRIAGANVNSIEGIDTTKTSAEYSVLWANFRLSFAQGYNSPVAVMYRTMRRGNLNLNFLLNTYNNKLANAWNETFINHDTWYKYIRPKDQPNYLYDSKGKHVLIDESLDENDPNNWALRDTNYVNLLYAAQGTRSEHRKQWLKRRMLLLDGKYAADSNAFKFGIRVNMLPKSETDTDMSHVMQVTADDTSYIWMNFKANSLTGGSPYGPIYIKEGTTVNIPLDADSLPTQEQESILLFVSNITDFGKFGRFGLANAATTNNTGMNLQFKLRTFDTSLTPYQQIKHNEHTANPWSTFDGKYYPLLEHLNLDYMYIHMTNANLSENTYLRTMSASHTNLQTITFPKGGVLTTVKLPNTLRVLDISNQPLLNSVTCDDDTWTELKTLSISNCPNLDTKTIFKIGKAKEDKISRIDLRDIYWELDPTDPEECTLDGQYIVDFPILNNLITTAGLEANAPWSITNDMQVGVSYYVGGTIRIKNGTNADAEHYGFDAVAAQAKYTGCFPRLNIIYDDNILVTSSFSTSFYDANKAIVTKYTKQYAMNTVSSLTANDIFGPLDLSDFAKQSERTHNYELIGFKISDDDSTDLFVETLKGATPVMLLDEAMEAANAAIDVKANIDWTEYNSLNTTVYDSTVTYYTEKSLYSLYKSEYIWQPSEAAESQEDKQQELSEYLKINSLYVYNGVTYNFVNDYTITADESHKSVAFYPVYVASVYRYAVDFYDDIEENNPSVAVRQLIKYSENADMDSINEQKIIKIDINKTNYAQTTVRNAIYAAVTDVRENRAVYPTFGEAQLMKNVPTGNEWFEISSFSVTDPTNESITISGTMLKIKEDYPYAAITIPKKYGSATIVGLGSNKQRTKFLIQNDIDALNAEYNAISNPTAEETKQYQLSLYTLLEELNKTVDLECVFVESGNSIKYIDHNAFRNNTTLAYFDFDNLSQLQMISNNSTYNDRQPTGTFYNCNNLKVTQLPNSITVLGTGAFSHCTSVALTTMPTELKYIGAGAFHNCTGLTSVNFGTGAENTSKISAIRAYAFTGCRNLRNSNNNMYWVFLGSIGDYAFADCTQWQMFTNGNSTNLSTIGQQAFANCTHLAMSVLPTGVSFIGNSAFLGAHIAGNFTIQETCFVISSYAFRNAVFDSGITFNIAEKYFSNYNITNNIFTGAVVPSLALALTIPSNSTYTQYQSNPQDFITQETTLPWHDMPWGAKTSGDSNTPVTVGIMVSD